MNKLIKFLKYFIYEIKIAIPILKLFPAYLKDSFLYKMAHVERTNQKILFTFDDEYLFRDDDNNGREPFYILKAFSDGGYEVYFYRKTDFRNYYRLRVFGRLIYSIKNLRFVSKIPANTQDFIYGFDNIRQDFLNLKWKKLVYINIKKATTSRIGNVIPMPFYVLPLISSTGANKDLEKYRWLNHRYRIFFGGNFTALYYNNPLFKLRYPHLMTRLEQLDVLIKSGLDVLLIKNKDEYKKFLNNNRYLNQVVIVQTEYTLPTRHRSVPIKLPIKPIHWLSNLAQSDFFMCFSGTDYPMCHNVIEAMSVGSVPILAYPEWFSPSLEHGKNAIIYSNKDDLIQKTKIVLKMPPEEIKNLRRGVIEYYENFLAKGCLARKYESESQSISTLMLFTHFVSEVETEDKGYDFISKLKKHNIPHA